MSKGYQPTATYKPSGTPPTTGTGVIPPQKTKVCPTPIYIVHHKDWRPGIFLVMDEAIDAIKELGEHWQMSIYLDQDSAKPRLLSVVCPECKTTGNDIAESNKGKRSDEEGRGI